jgi:predicted transcriptional regulator of viral defense system
LTAAWEITTVVNVPVKTLAELPDQLLSEGTSWFTADQAAEATGVPVGRVYPGLKRLVDRDLVFSPARGFYVPIPPEYRSWKSVPATLFIDPMMRHLNRRYYVGLLSAAELHGAAHQRPQVFQVMVAKSLPNRHHGRARLAFYQRSRLEQVPTMRRPTATGQLVLSTPEATALDLAARPVDGGGLDNVATVLVELARDGKLRADALGTAAETSTTSALRRAGWLLDRYTDLDVSSLHELTGSVAPTKLDPHSTRSGPIDTTWGLIINATVEPEA